MLVSEYYDSPLHGHWMHPVWFSVANCYHGYPVTVTLVSCDSVTTLRLHLQHTGVRATSLACLLGLGLGLGSLLVYRLCRRLFGTRRPSCPAAALLQGKDTQDEPLCSQERSSSQLSSNCSCTDHPSPDTLSDSGVSTMGNYQSDASSAISPDSSFPSVLYNSAGSVRFRGFRKDDRLLEEERNPLMQASSSSGQNQTDEDDETDDEDEDEDDETQGLLSGRRKPKRSPASMRQQLTIDIPVDEGSSIHYQRGLSTPGSDIDGVMGNDEGFQRDVSFDGQSIGGMSLMPNFSPTSLHEKNLRLVDDGPESPSADEGIITGESTSGDPQSEVDKPMSVDLKAESSIPRGSATELTSCVLHPLRRPGDSPSSTNESDSSKICEGSTSSRTQSEYLSSEPRSRSLSPEVMTILSKYCNSFDSSGSVSPECIKRGAGRSTRRTVKLSSSEPGKNDIDDWLDRRRPCLKHSSSSVSSTASSIDLSSRDLTLRARSLDFSDNPSGMATPDSDLYNPGDVGLKTAASMEQIQKELSNIEQEIADMSTKVQVLNSQENLHTVDRGSSDDALTNVLRVLVRHRSREDAVMTRSLSSCQEHSEAEAAEAELLDELSDSRLWRHSYHHQGQYVWDYQSDLNSGVTPPTRRRFIDHWGTLDESRESSKQNSRSQSHSRDHSGAQSPSFDHILSHLRQSGDSSMDSSIEIPQTSSSLADLYIDDDLSGLVTGDTKLQVDGLLQAAATNSDATSLDSVDSVTSSDANCCQTAPPGQRHEYTRLGPPEEEETGSSSKHHSDPHSGPHGLLTDAGVDVVDGRHSEIMQQKSDGMMSVGPRQDLRTYANREWKGDTDRARTILQGYEEICSENGLSALRCIRGDNYCALRAVLFQALRTGVPLIEHLGDRDTVLEKLNIFTGSEYSYLQQDWTFAGRLSHGKDSMVDTANQCISTLFSKIEDVRTRPTSEEREVVTEHIFNSCVGREGAGARDELLMEALKLLMLLSAYKLLIARDAGMPIPTFAELLFARDTSCTLRSFIKNHLNVVGDSGGLEQIEMFLLGYTLGVQIRVYRPAYHGQSDFCTLYADDSAGSSAHTVCLVAEDDRHYNVLL